MCNLISSRFDASNSVPAVSWYDTAKLWAKGLKREVTALNYAAADPLCPTMAKVIAVGTVAYALSPVDAIPDWIPVLGYLDDLIIVPAGIALSRYLIPEELMEKARQSVDKGEKLPKNWVVGALVISSWVVGGAYFSYQAASYCGVC